MAITSYRDLEVYQRSMRVLVQVHQLVLGFPDFERYGLTDQMRRASKSVPANIAEGYGRRTSAKEFKHFLSIALGSTNEMAVHLEVARALEYPGSELGGALIEEYTVIGKMLFRLMESWRTIPAGQRRSSSNL